MSDPTENPDEPLNETVPPLDDQIQDLTPTQRPLDETIPPMDLMERADNQADALTREHPRATGGETNE